MPVPHDPHPPRPRYAYETITDEIQKVIAGAPYGTKARCARAIGIERSAFNHFLAQRRTTPEGRGQRFSYEQIGVIAQVVGEALDRPNGAPAGWPFIAWNDAEKFEAFLKLVPGRV